MSEPQCVHGDDLDKCPFCSGNSTSTENSKKKTRKSAKKIDAEPEPPRLNRTANRVLDKTIDIIKDAEWPDWAEPEDWRMVAVHAIEKHFGRI